MDWTLKFLIAFEACILIGAATLLWKAYRSMRRVCKNKDTENERGEVSAPPGRALP